MHSAVVVADGTPTQAMVEDDVSAVLDPLGSAVQL
jgi:hypothetical protein